MNMKVICSFSELFEKKYYVGDHNASSRSTAEHGGLGFSLYVDACRLHRGPLFSFQIFDCRMWGMQDDENCKIIVSGARTKT